MAAVEGSSQEAIQQLPVPATFQTVESIIELTSEQLQRKPLVNVIGVIKDYQPPIKTNGTDWKSTLTINDLSSQYSDGLKVNIFGSHDRMPHISSAGDVVIVRAFRAQLWNGYVSLLSNAASDVIAYHSANIPSWPCSQIALPSPASTMRGRLPSVAEQTYVTQLPSCFDKTILPEKEKFEERVVQAMVRKEKYSLLKDVKSDAWHDIMGEVIRFYEDDGRGTVYVSDYTAHSLFYDNVRQGAGGAVSRDGDEYGYTNSKSKAAKDWPGPYGKLSIQLTAFEPHLTFLRENVKVGDWVMLQNVQFRMGKMGGCLEGFLRTEWDNGGKVNVRILSRPEDPSDFDPKWKACLRRKKEYHAKFKASLKVNIEEDGESAGKGTSTGKRKSDAPQSGRLNSKSRRKLERATVLKKVAAAEQRNTVEDLDILDLNQNVKCEHSDIPTTSLHDILKKNSAIMSKTGQQYLVPFSNRNFRANVRVINYFPHKLEDFSVGRRENEYDMLTDDSGGEDTDCEEDMRQFRDGKGYGGRKNWEWRFALQVEHARKTELESPEKIWLIVDNHSAQRLLGQDATNLRQDKEGLAAFREQIFHLWGDLEEKKSAFLETPAGKTLLRGRPATPEPEERPQSRPNWHTEILPPDSDDEKEPQPKTINGRIPKPNILSERDPNAGSSPSKSQEKETLGSAILALSVHNKGFTCCIREFGIKVPEEDDSKADAGEGFRYERNFGLFGTMIAPPDEGNDGAETVT